MRNKHITINLSDEDYRTLELLASYYRRSISELTAMIVADNAHELFIQQQLELYPENKEPMKKALFVPKRY